MGTHHPEVYLWRSCRACRGDLTPVLDLGELKLNAFPTHVWEISQIPQVQLQLMVCRGCGLVQLDRTVPQDWMFRRYWYRSGVNEIMVDELRDIVTDALARVGCSQRDWYLDIGANDGTLLQVYGSLGLRQRVAVEPAENLQETLRQHAEIIIKDYFPFRTELDRQFKIITAIAMCYDLEDPIGFFQAIHRYLAPGGIAIVQFQDLAQQIESAAFDTICHEHLEYYSLWSLSQILLQAGLEPVHVDLRAINGGSLRVTLMRREDHGTKDLSVAAQLSHEAQLGLDTLTLRSGNLGALERFQRRVQQATQQIAAVLDQIRDAGQVMDVYGASTKGNILLQVMKVDPLVARYAIDRSPAKWGQHTITGIPIVGEDVGREDPAQVWFCPIWQFREGVLRRERWFLEGGRSIVFPLPRTEVVHGSYLEREQPV